jgi:hypothetical protein
VGVRLLQINAQSSNKFSSSPPEFLGRESIPRREESRKVKFEMSGYSTVTTFFDESGKFKDHDVVCFGGVASYSEDIARFAQEWGRLLAINGIKEFSAKHAFNPRRPLGKKNSAIGVRKRIAALRPFIQCIRNNLLVVTGVTVDVPAFNELPSHLYQIYGKDPAFMAFMRTLLYVLDFTPHKEKISFICDDEEQMALPFYRMYRRIKKMWPGAKEKLAAISFVDSSVLWGVQAADLLLDCGLRKATITARYSNN